MGYHAQSRTVIGLSIICLLVLDLTSGNLPPPVPESNTWCFIHRDCNQDSPTSDWNKGTCKGGKSQSPIDITADYAAIVGDAAIDFSEARHNYDFTSFTMKNTGKFLGLNAFKTATGKTPSFDFNENTYTLQEIHLHWGIDNHEGSEHSIGGRRYSMEIHLVHIQTGDGGYKTIDEARKSGKKDALAVIALFIQADKVTDHHHLEDMSKNLDKVAIKGSTATVDGSNLRLSELIEVHKKAITYSGSLTVPTCDEVVTWLILPIPIKAIPECVKAFREKLQRFDGESLNKNNRNIQPANGRLVGIVNLKQET